MQKWIMPVFLFFLVSNVCFGQNERNRHVRLSTKSIEVTMGPPWDYDAPVKEDVFNNYVLKLTKDSSTLDLDQIIKNYSSAGTRSILIVDTLLRPFAFDGDKDFKPIKYSYRWKWDKNGRLVSIDEYVYGKLKKHIVLAEKHKPNRTKGK